MRTKTLRRAPSTQSESSERKGLYPLIRNAGILVVFDERLPQVQIAKGPFSVNTGVKLSSRLELTVLHGTLQYFRAYQLVHVRLHDLRVLGRKLLLALPGLGPRPLVCSFPCTI